MSTRLKRKLGDMGIDPASAKANESFCLIGTPLPPLEKSKDNGEFVPLWKQDVRDEQGRRRLHGAFTGGFSAGYFNSVGSKEGWTPATFTSSRTDRSKKKAARPEDFMDEEDLQELRDGKNLVDTTDEMDFQDQQRSAVDPEQESMASILEASMLPAPKDSAGARILKKMGWRLGQGIGPRVSYRQRKLQDKQIGIDAMAVDEDEEEATKHTYAPRDTPILLVDRKDNSHGIGYDPGMGLNASLGVKGSKGPVGPKLASGFGLGALNDADEDDLDVYDGAGGIRGRSGTAYDIGSRDDDDDRIVIGSKTHSKQPAPRPASSVQTFHDGKPVLAGFVLSDEPVAEDRWFPMPEIPKGWKPDPTRVWNQDKSRLKTKENQDPRKWNNTITADERGSILGETQLPSAPRSVFDYMSQKDRERLQKIASGSVPIGTAPEPATITIPPTDPHIAQAALKGFQPFPTDPSKQQRYAAYLQTQATPNVPPPPLITALLQPRPGQSIEGFNKELVEYAQAALLFKPMSAAMAGRFTSAAVVENGPVVHVGLHTPSAEDFAAKEKAEEKRIEESVTPKVHAAKMGMYGVMTREVSTWVPAKLLCKRFGVKDPTVVPDDGLKRNASSGSAQTTGEAWKADDGSGIVGEKFATGNDLEMAMQQVGMRTGGGKRRDLANVGLGDDEEQGKETLTYERPAMDIFKAIFASDDEDSDDEVVAEQEEEKVPSRKEMPTAPPVASTSKLATDEMTIPPPPLPPPALVTEEKFDAASFKPTFIPRASIKPGTEETGEKRKKKKSSKTKTLLSFGMEEDEDGGAKSTATKDSERPKKKKQRKEKSKSKPVEDADDDAMWVEKPPPEIVKEHAKVVVPVVFDKPDALAGSAKGRKRAVDFM